MFFLGLTRRKLKMAVALTLTTTAVLGLVTLKIYGARSSNATAGGATAGPAGWQDRQPVAGETLTAFSQDLKSPENRRSKDGELRTTLRVAPAVAQAGPLAPPLNVRAYEGSVPGPTLRVKPGDRLVVNLVEAWPNVTNIHVHGLHVSPSGVGDNIYRRVGPGDASEYVYDLPADHYPGIFYYHPHFEGSSSVQTLGGMSGAIIVEDPEGSLPPEVEPMREVIAVLQETNIESGSLRNYKSASKISGSRMPLYGSTRGGDGGADGAENGGQIEGDKSEMLHFVTVNGQYQPVIRAHPGEAFRLRVVHGGNNDHMYVSLVPAADAAAPRSSGSSGSSGTKEGKTGGGGLLGKEAENGWTGMSSGSSSSSSSGGCTLLTLARDGVYLPAPRRQGGGDGRLVLAPGSRADVAVRCDRPGVYRLSSSKGAAGEGADGDGDDEMSIMDYLGHKTDVFEGTLAFVKVGGDEMDMKLPTESPAGVSASRLLQNLREFPENEVSRFVFEFNAAGKVSHLNQTYTWYGVNGVQYNNASQVMRRVPLASLEEWVIVNQRKGKGEGTEGCDSPRPPPSTVTTELKDPGESGVGFSSSSGGGNDAGNGSGDAAEDAGGGQRHTRGRSMRKRRRGLGGLSEGPHGAAGGGAERTEEKEG
ncbi:unnamed protein product, partial [Pylaiella littoralis]